MLFKSGITSSVSVGLTHGLFSFTADLRCEENTALSLESYWKNVFIDALLGMVNGSDNQEADSC